MKIEQKVENTKFNKKLSHPEGTEFYRSDSALNLDVLDHDDRTTTEYIDTPDQWKCERKNCPISIKHEHTTYTNL